MGKRELSKLLGISQSTCSRIPRECVPRVELQKEGAQDASPLRNGQTCVRAIIAGGLYNIVDKRNALSEHLNVVVRSNTMRHALHEVGLGTLEKHKKPLLTTKNCIAIYSKSSLLD